MNHNNIESGSVGDDNSTDNTNGSMQSSDSNCSKRSRDDDKENEIPVANKRTRVDPKILDGKYFTPKTRTGENVRATCSLCGAVRSGSVKATGNFFRHINEKHPEYSLEVKKYLSTKPIIAENGLVQTKLTDTRPLITNDKVSSWFH